MPSALRTALHDEHERSSMSQPPHFCLNSSDAMISVVLNTKHQECSRMHCMSTDTYHVHLRDIVLSRHDDLSLNDMRVCSIELEP